MEPNLPSINLSNLTIVELDAVAHEALKSNDKVLKGEILKELRQRSIKLDTAFALLEQVKENPTQPITIDHTINALIFKISKQNVYYGYSVVPPSRDVIEKQCYKLKEKYGQAFLSQIIYSQHVQLEKELQMAVDSVPDLRSTESINGSFSIGFFPK